MVELLIVIAIIALLIQLMLPAVQASRERARKAECQNHLKQLALAAQSHLAVHNFFPSGGWSDTYTADPRRGYGREQPGSWLFSELAYIEEPALRDAGGERLEDFPLGAGITGLYESAPALFYCPSRRAAQAYPFKRAGNGHWTLRVAQGILLLPVVTKCDYAANSGEANYSAAEQFDDQPEMWAPKSYDALTTQPQLWTETNNPETPYFQNGVSYYRSQVKPAQVLDGLSKTYFCGEKFLSPEFYDDVNVSESPGMMGDDQSAWVGFDWDNHRVAWNPKARWPQETYQPQQDASGLVFQNCFAFGSAHPGSLNMAFCDGSVQTVSYDIDMTIHRQMANRLDGD